MPKVGAIVLTRGKPDLLENLLGSMPEAIEGLDFRLVVVEHETDEAGPVLDAAPVTALRARLTDDPQPQSFSSLNNHGAEKLTDSDYLLLLNNDVILKPETIKEMLAAMEAHPEVGVVGAKLVFPDGTFQHIGVVFEGNGMPYHYGRGKPDDGTFMPAERDDYFDVVTFACVMIRRKVWDQLGGMDAAFHFNYDDVDFCLRAREAGWKCFYAHKASAYHLEGSSLKYRQSQRHSAVSNMETFRQRWIASGRLEKIVHHRFPRPISPAYEKLVRVAFVPADPNSGISVWRIMGIAGKLSDKKLALIEILDPGGNHSRAERALMAADVVVWQAHFSESVLRFASMKGRPWAFLYEYDDHPLHLSPYAFCYQGLGCQEQKVRTETGEEVWLWRDGECGFDLERNRENRIRQMEIIHLSDGVTTTTQPLARYFERYNSKVWTLPNCIDFQAYKALDGVFRRTDSPPVRLGWWGGDNHWHDIAMVGEPLTAFLNRMEGRARMIFMGGFYRGPFKDVNLNYVEELPWVHAEAWPYRLACAALDVVIIPLGDPAVPHLRFNHFKSDVKWLEASALKIPCLVQAGRRAYENCIDGETALTFEDDDEFTEKLEALTKDPELRRRIGQNAHDWAREHRDIDKEIHRWAEAYEEASRMRGKLFEPEPEPAPAKTNAVAEGS